MLGLKNVSSAIALIVAGFSALFFVGCVARTSLDYTAPVNYSIPNLTGRISLAVVDHRRYVLDGSQPAHYVGTAANSLGMLANATTKSKKPLAEELQQSVAATFAGYGLEVQNFFIKPTQSIDPLWASVGRKKNQVKTAVLIEIIEWKSSENDQFKLSYHLNLKIISASQKEALLISKQGEKSLAAEIADLLLAELLNDLFTDKRVSKKLGMPRKTATVKKAVAVRATAAPTKTPTKSSVMVPSKPLIAASTTPSPIASAAIKVSAQPTPRPTVSVTKQPLAVTTTTTRTTTTTKPVPTTIQVIKQPLTTTTMPKKPVVVEDQDAGGSNTLSVFPDIEDTTQAPVTEEVVEKTPPPSVNSEGCSPRRVLELLKQGYSEKDISAVCH